MGFFFFLQVQSVVEAQLRALSGAASSAQDPSAGSLGVRVCLLSTFCHEKRKTVKRAFVGGHHKSLKFSPAMDGVWRKNQNNLSETVNV